MILFIAPYFLLEFGIRFEQTLFHQLKTGFSNIGKTDQLIKFADKKIK